MESCKEWVENGHGDNEVGEPTLSMLILLSW